jgi:hypothetical protein
VSRSELIRLAGLVLGWKVYALSSQPSGPIADFVGSRHFVLAHDRATFSKMAGGVRGGKKWREEIRHVVVAVVERRRW